MTQSISHSDVAHVFAEKARLQVCRITLPSGQQFDFKNNIVELSYFEDIYGFCRSGYVMLRDGVGFLDAFSITGGEKIEILIGGPVPMPLDRTMEFTIYKIGERKPTGNMNSEFYKLYFCNKDLLTNEQTKVSKSYKGKKISDIVRDILKTYLKTKTDFKITNTTGVYDFVVPMMKPYQAISWLSNFAIPEVHGASGPLQAGADMFFFESAEGYKFVSLSQLTNSYVPPNRKYKYQQNNLNEQNAEYYYEHQSVLAIDFVQSSNILKDISSGAFANKVIAVDPLTKTTTTQVFDYEKFLVNNAPQNGNGINPNIKTPDGLKPNQTPETNLKVVLTNSQQKYANYVKATNKEAVSQDLFTQQTLSQRTAQTALFNHTVVKIVVPGDPTLSVGQTLEFQYPKLTMQKNSRELDPTYSGVYLITSVRHILQSTGVYQTVLEIAKNSSKKPIPQNKG